MTKQTINIGTTGNDGSGDPLRTAFTKTNENFTEVYAIAQSAYTYANTIVSDTQIDQIARNTANAGFTVANTINVSVQASFTQANTSNITAQAAFDTANTINVSVQASFTQANTSNITAQAAFNKANTTSNTTITIVSLKSLVANNATYADFQTAIASL